MPPTVVRWELYEFLRRYFVMRWSFWVITGVVLAGVGLACDDKDTLAPEEIKARQTEQQRSRIPASPVPTTRELLTGKKKTVQLGGFPLTLEVPVTWALHSSGDSAVITLSGLANSGEIIIQLVQPGKMNGAKLPKSTMATAQKEMADKPHPLNRLEMRLLGPMRVLEQRMITNAFVNGKVPAEVWGDVESNDNLSATKTVTHTILNPQILKWSFTFFEPGEKGTYMVRGLTFLSLRVSEYEQDKEFLEQMMQSLKYQVE